MGHRLLLLAGILVGLTSSFVACTDDTSDGVDDPAGAADGGGAESSSSGTVARDAAAPADDAATATDAATSADAAPTDAGDASDDAGDAGDPADAGGPADAGDPADAGADDAGDASASDAGDGDAGSDDAGDGDAGSDDAGDASRDDAGDGGAGNPNLAPMATATATSEYSGAYAPANANDGVLSTSWYAATGVCDTNPDAGPFLCTSPTSVTLTFPASQTIGLVKIFGNRDAFPTGYDVLSARIELLDVGGTVVDSADVTMTRGAEPNGDAARAFDPPAAAVRSIRVAVLTGEASGPGLGEIEAYAR